MRKHLALGLAYHWYSENRSGFHIIIIINADDSFPEDSVGEWGAVSFSLSFL